MTAQVALVCALRVDHGVLARSLSLSLSSVAAKVPQISRSENGGNSHSQISHTERGSGSVSQISHGVCRRETRPNITARRSPVTTEYVRVDTRNVSGPIRLYIARARTYTITGSESGERYIDE